MRRGTVRQINHLRDRFALRHPWREAISLFFNRLLVSVDESALLAVVSAFKLWEYWGATREPRAPVFLDRNVLQETLMTETGYAKCL